MKRFNWNLTKFAFLSALATTLRCYAEKIENLEFNEGVNFEIIDLLKNNATNYLLIIDDSWEQNCSSKAVADIALAGGDSALSTNSIKCIWFHQSKLGQDVELQNT